MNLNEPELVTAVIPTRNRPGPVVKAVQSALRQTHPAMEVVVVIDGADPATELTLAGIPDRRLRVIRLAVNVGGAEARNVGVRTARGRWIAFLDDDDEWFPQKIAVQLAAARASNTALPVVFSHLIVRTPREDFCRPLRAYYPGKPISEHLFCRHSFADGPYAMQTSTLLVPRDLLLAVPFRRGLKRHQDWDWLLRAASHPGVSFHVVPEPLIVFHVEDARSSVSRSLDWQFSLEWAKGMRPLFTPRAYSFFIATECFSRAIRKRAGLAVYTLLAREFIGGAPTLRALAWLAAFSFFPQNLRTCLRSLMRRRQFRQSAVPSAPLPTGAFTQTLTN